MVRMEISPMATSLAECEKTAKRLPLSDRARLIEPLISSLDDLDEAECERLWIDEAERRYAAYKAGKITARPAAEVFRDARARLAAV